MKREPTQCEKIVKYISKFGSITSIDAFRDLGITRLAARISDLSSAGYTIKKKTETGRNKSGRVIHFTRYSFGN